jgi:hypothetical protein
MAGNDFSNGAGPAAVAVFLTGTPVVATGSSPVVTVFTQSRALAVDAQIRVLTVNAEALL